ncbi:MAG: hypothetical protein JNM17_32275 [Archangium sp.]|nr:hypothetical protein [Archangium sp.]
MHRLARVSGGERSLIELNAFGKAAARLHEQSKVVQLGGMIWFERQQLPMYAFTQCIGCSSTQTRDRRQRLSDREVVLRVTFRVEESPEAFEEPLEEGVCDWRGVQKPHVDERFGVPAKRHDHRQIVLPPIEHLRCDVEAPLASQRPVRQRPCEPGRGFDVVGPRQLERSQRLPRCFLVRRCATRVDR